MTAEQFKDWLKVGVASPSYTIGKLDTSKPQTICVYSGLSAGSNRPAVGNDKGYGEKTMRLLLRWGKNFAIAEGKAQEVYDAMTNLPVEICGVNTSIVCRNSEPVSLGSDDTGVYEFSIDIILYYER